MILRLFSLLCFLPVSAEKYHLYLLAGQSNMDGRGQSSDLSDAQRVPSRQAIIYYRNPPYTSDGWQPLAPGFSIPPKFKGKLPSPTFGPEIGFISRLSEAQPTRKFALIKGSKGGTSLRADWKPGLKDQPKTQGPRYRDFLKTIALAQAALKKGGHTATLRGLIWHQGESDSKAKVQLHQERLSNFIARIREDLGTPQLPIVLGQVYDNGKRDKVRAAILKTSQSAPHCGFASAKNLTTWDPGTHFDAASQLTLGHRFAEAILNLAD